MKKLNSLFNKTISYKTIWILLVCILALLLFPMLYISKFNIPSADDYSYGLLAHNIVENGGTIADVFKTMIDQFRYFYENWQGTFSCVFLALLQPAAFGEQYYIIVPYMILLSLIPGIFFLVITFFSYFSDKKIITAIIACTISIICTQFLPTPVEGFYWFDGAVSYTLFFGLSLILISFFFRYLFNKEHHRSFFEQLLVIILCIIIALSNLITAFITLLILVSFFLFSIVQKKHNWKLFLLPVVFYGISFYINVSSPGFFIRQDIFTTRAGVIKSIWLSLQYAINQLYQWNPVPVLALYIFLIPGLWKIVSESTFSFKLPWLVSLYSFGLLAAMNCPTYYAYWDPGPGRVENIRFYTMVILIVFNLFYWEGWFSKRIMLLSPESVNGLKLSFLLGLLLLFSGGLVLSNNNKPMTSVSAVLSYRNGEAGLYKHVYNQRLEILKDPEIKDALLRDFPKKPYVLFFSDITYDPTDWHNVALSDYYHKNSVRLMTHEEFEESLEKAAGGE